MGEMLGRSNGARQACFFPADKRKKSAVAIRWAIRIRDEGSHRATAIKLQLVYSFAVKPGGSLTPLQFFFTLSATNTEGRGCSAFIGVGVWLGWRVGMSKQRGGLRALVPYTRVLGKVGVCAMAAMALLTGSA